MATRRRGPAAGRGVARGADDEVGDQVVVRRGRLAWSSRRPPTEVPKKAGLNAGRRRRENELGGGDGLAVGVPEIEVAG